MRVATDKDFTSVLIRLQKGFVIKEKCAMLNIVKFKIQLSSKDFQPKLPEWPKGNFFQIATQEQWETALPQIISHRREMIGALCFVCAMQRISVNEIISGHILGRLPRRIYFITIHVEVIQYTDTNEVKPMKITDHEKINVGNSEESFR